MENIDQKIAEILGKIFSPENDEPINPSDLVGRVCSLRMFEGDSVICYESKISEVFYRFYLMLQMTQVVTAIILFFGREAKATITFPKNYAFKPNFDWKKNIHIRFEGLPVYNYSKGKG